MSKELLKANIEQKKEQLKIARQALKEAELAFEDDAWAAIQADDLSILNMTLSDKMTLWRMLDRHASEEYDLLTTVEKEKIAKVAEDFPDEEEFNQKLMKKVDKLRKSFKLKTFDFAELYEKEETTFYLYDVTSSTELLTNKNYLYELWLLLSIDESFGRRVVSLGIDSLNFEAIVSYDRGEFLITLLP